MRGTFQISRWNRMFPRFTTNSLSVARIKRQLMRIKQTWKNCDKSSKRLGVEGKDFVFFTPTQVLLRPCGIVLLNGFDNPDDIEIIQT